MITRINSFSILVVFFASIGYAPWVFSASTLIASGSMSGANIDILGVPSTYDYLQLSVSGVSVDTAGRSVLVRVSADNGSTFFSSSYYTWLTRSSTPFTTSDGIFETGSIGSAGGSASFASTFFGYQGGSFVSVSSASTDTSGGNSIGNGMYGGGTSAVNAIRILVDGSGNFDAGTYSLYGITASATSSSSGGSSATSTLSTIEDPNRDYFFGVVVFFMVFFLMVWLFRRPRL